MLLALPQVDAGPTSEKVTYDRHGAHAPASQRRRQAWSSLEFYGVSRQGALRPTGAHLESTSEAEENNDGRKREAQNIPDQGKTHLKKRT